MSTLLNKNPERRVQYKIDANKTEIMFPNLECLSAALLRDLLPSGSTPAGDSAYITDASDLVPVESLKVNIQPVQAGTGDPSPENIREITGWNSVKVTRAGKNLIDFAGIAPAEGARPKKEVYLAAGTYYLFQFTANSQHNTYSRYSLDNGTYNSIPTEDDGNIVADYSSGSYGRMKNKFVLHVPCWVQVEIGGNSSTAENPIDFMLTTDGNGYSSFPVSGSTLGYKDTLYTPFVESDTYTIPLGQTVYGGTLDVTTGELVVDKGYIASYNGETLPGKWLSDRDVYSVGATPTTGAQVVYELATPQTYTLTPQEITLLFGDNTVFADAGPIEVTYGADIQKYIDKKIAETQALILEN